jgi:hypothetical protein
MASAIKKILLKKGINAAGKSGLGFIFDERDYDFFELKEYTMKDDICNW